MTEDPNPLIEQHLAGDLSTEESQLLSDQLERDAHLADQLVEMSQLDQRLRRHFSPDPIINPISTSTRRWKLLAGVGTLATAMALGFIFLFKPDPSQSLAQSENNPKSPSFPKTVLAPGSKLLSMTRAQSNPRPRAMEQRLSDFSIPEIDLRGLTVSQAVNLLETEANRLSGDDTPPWEFVYEVAANEAEPLVPLYRRGLSLDSTLEYLAALGGRELMITEGEVRFEPSTAPPTVYTQTYKVSPLVYLDEGRPDHLAVYQAANANDNPFEQEPALQPVSNDDVRTRLQAWGLSPDTQVSSLADGNTVIIRGPLAEQRLLSTILKLATSSLKAIKVETWVYQQASTATPLPQFEPQESVDAFLQRLREQPGIDILSAPHVVTREFQAAAIEIMTEHNVPRGKDAVGETVFETVWSGMRTDVMAHRVGADLALDLKFESRGDPVEGEENKLTFENHAVMETEVTLSRESPVMVATLGNDDERALGLVVRLEPITVPKK